MPVLSWLYPNWRSTKFEVSVFIKHYFDIDYSAVWWSVSGHWTYFYNMIVTSPMNMILNTGTWKLCSSRRVTFYTCSFKILTRIKVKNARSLNKTLHHAAYYDVILIWGIFTQTLKISLSYSRTSALCGHTNIVTNLKCPNHNKCV